MIDDVGGNIDWAPLAQTLGAWAFAWTPPVRRRLGIRFGSGLGRSNGDSSAAENG